MTARLPNTCMLRLHTNPTVPTAAPKRKQREEVTYAEGWKYLLELEEMLAATPREQVHKRDAIEQRIEFVRHRLFPQPAPPPAGPETRELRKLSYEELDQRLAKAELELALLTKPGDEEERAAVQKKVQRLRDEMDSALYREGRIDPMIEEAARKWRKTTDDRDYNREINWNAPEIKRAEQRVFGSQ